MRTKFAHRIAGLAMYQKTEGYDMLAMTNTLEINPSWPVDFQNRFAAICEQYFESGLRPVACTSNVRPEDYAAQLRAETKTWDTEDHERAYWMVSEMKEYGNNVPPLVIVGGDVVDGFYQLRAMELGQIDQWPAILLPAIGEI